MALHELASGLWITTTGPNFGWSFTLPTTVHGISTDEAIDQPTFIDWGARSPP